MVLAYDDIIEETELAICIQFGEDDDPEYSEPIWIPKSCIITIEKSINEIELLDWICIEKNLVNFSI